jgi:hypothetical protein
VVTSRSSAARRRIACAAALVVVIAMGLGTRFALPPSPFADIAGDALYAVAAYLAVALIAPRLGSAWSAGIAIAWCVGVELLQLTGIPAGLGAVFPPARLVLGTGFDPRDLVVYTVAVLVVAGLDAGIRARTAPRT